MQNMKIEVTGTNTLVITVDLSKPVGQSSSGKSTILATSGGNISVPGREDVKIGLNVYTQAGKERF